MKCKDYEKDICSTKGEKGQIGWNTVKWTIFLEVLMK